MIMSRYHKKYDIFFVGVKFMSKGRHETQFSVYKVDYNQGTKFFYEEMGKKINSFE